MYYTNNSFVKIAAEKVADDMLHISPDYEGEAVAAEHRGDKILADREKSLAFSDNLERMRAGEGGLNTIKANINEYTRPLREWLSGKHEELDKLIKDHPTKALAAGAGAGAAGAGGILGGLLGRSKHKSGKALAAANSRIKTLSGRSKALALLAALGIPASAAATYFATRDKRK